MKHTLARFLLSAALLVSSARAADVTINSLPAISAVTSSTVVPVVDVSGTPTTKKATVTQFIAGLPAATSGSDGKMVAADKAKLDNATAANTASTLVARDSSGNFTAGTITVGTITGLGSPTNPTDAANKAYVDAAAAGLVIKTPAVAATTGTNITLTAGAPNTLDGVTLHTNDRVLVKDQSDDKQNGIYYVATLGSGANGTWTRTTDADTGAKLVTGSYIFISGGTVNVQSSWTMVTTGTITIGTSSITWNLFSQTTQILASNIIGQIVGSQVQNGAINTAKFATGLTPVEIVSTLPGSGNFTGRTVFLTSDSQLYRYNGSSFTVAVPAVDITGQITTTQITDGGISTPKLAANAVTAAKIAANTITASQIQANSLTTGTIAAGAITTTELAAGAVNTTNLAANAVTAGKIAANTITAGQIASGTITADRMAVSDLSAIAANIGTITNGSLTSSASVTVGSGNGAVSISSAGLTIAAGRISMSGDGTNPWIKVLGSSPYASAYVWINGYNGVVPPSLDAVDNSGVLGARVNGLGMFLANAKSLNLGSGSRLQKTSSDTWTPKMFDGAHDIEFQWDGSDLKVRIDGSTVKTIPTI